MESVNKRPQRQNLAHVTNRFFLKDNLTIVPISNQSKVYIYLSLKFCTSLDVQNFSTSVIRKSHHSGKAGWIGPGGRLVARQVAPSTAVCGRVLVAAVMGSQSPEHIH